MKSEPSVFSINDLKHKEDQTQCWDGVRNYQARNMIRDEMKKGDLAFFYHSSCKQPGIAGIMAIVSDAYPDPTQFDKTSAYFDPEVSVETPRWFSVDVKLIELFDTIITLDKLRTIPDLNDMVVLRKGNRLSVTPVTKQEWKTVLALLAEKK